MVEWFVYIIIEEMKIYDNFLPDEIFQKLFSYMKGYEFKWNMTKVVDDTEENYITNRPVSYTHLTLPPTPYV